MRRKQSARKRSRRDASVLHGKIPEVYLGIQFEFRSPFGSLGRAADHFFLERYMRRFIVNRNAALKKIAESDEWKRYLKSA
jgi:hypothetical protein